MCGVYCKREQKRSREQSQHGRRRNDLPSDWLFELISISHGSDSLLVVLSFTLQALARIAVRALPWQAITGAPPPVINFFLPYLRGSRAACAPRRFARSQDCANPCSSPAYDYKADEERGCYLMVQAVVRSCARGPFALAAPMSSPKVCRGAEPPPPPTSGISTMLSKDSFVKRGSELLAVSGVFSPFATQSCG